MKGKPLYRIVKAATLACAALAMLALVSRRLLSWWAGRMLGRRILWNTADGAGAIGIIGGADGPTAIFTTAQIAPPLLWAAVLTGLAAVGLAVLFVLKKHSKME